MQIFPHIYEEAVSRIWLFTRSLLIFLYMRTILIFLSVPAWNFIIPILPVIRLCMKITLRLVLAHYTALIKKYHIYKEIQNGAVAKSCMTNGLLIYGEIFSHFLDSILGSLSSSSYMTLQLLHSEFPFIWGKFDFLFYECVDTLLIRRQECRQHRVNILKGQNLISTSLNGLH